MEGSFIQNSNYKWYKFLLKKEHTVFFIILFLCFGLRIFNFSSASLWVDEGYSLMLAHQKSQEIVKISVNDINPPFYGLAIRKWAKTFGFSHTSIRFFSVMCSFFTALVLYRIGRKFLNYLSAIIIVLLYSLSNLQIYFAEEARGYALVGLLCSISIYYTMYYIKYKKTWSLIFLALINILVLHTHYVAGFLFAGEAVAVFFVFYNRFRILLKYVLSQIIVVAAFLPWFLSSWFKLDSIQISWLPELSGKLIYTFFLQVFNNEQVVLILGAWLILASCLMFFIKNKKKLKMFLGLFFMASIPFILICLSTAYYIRLFNDRYILFSTIPIFIFLGFLLSSTRIHLAVKAAILILYLYCAISSVRIDAFRNEAWDDACLAGSVLTNDSTSVILHPHYVNYVFDYYNLKWAYENDYKQLDAYRNRYSIFPVKDTNQIKELAGRLHNRIIYYSSHFWGRDDKAIEKFLSKTHDQVFFREYWNVRLYVYEKKGRN